MPTPAKNKISFQITINKEVMENIDAIIEAINELHNPSFGKITRSTFIERVLIQYIVDATMTTEERDEHLTAINKEEKVNA